MAVLFRVFALPIVFGDTCGCLCRSSWYSVVLCVCEGEALVYSQGERRSMHHPLMHAARMGHLLMLRPNLVPSPKCGEREIAFIHLLL